MAPQALVVLGMRSDIVALPFVDSSRGSSIPSKQSSHGIDEEVVAQIQSRVELRDEDPPKKRKFREISRQLPADEIDPNSDLEVLTEEESEGPELEIPAQGNKRFCVGVRLPSFVYPKSQYEGYKYSLPKEKEWLAVKEFLVSRNGVNAFGVFLLTAAHRGAKRKRNSAGIGPNLRIFFTHTG